jgi:uncharacterized metal-binding protein
MAESSPDFMLAVEGIKGSCPAGETYAARAEAEGQIPVLSCEGPCIRGEIARLTANIVAREVPSLARACHAETFLVPHSAMAHWVGNAPRAVMIDGCFLKCHGRVLRKLIGADKVVQIDTNPLHKKFSDVFLMDDVPEEQRKAVAREVADKVVALLKQTDVVPA